MPRGYRPVPVPRSSGTGVISAARLGSAAGDLNDALLLGSAQSRKEHPFTPEVRAAYYAFCGIGEKDARRLWQGNVTFDDVNAYTDAGVPATARDASGTEIDMNEVLITMKQSRIAPQDWAAWATVLSDEDYADKNLIDRVASFLPLLVDPEAYTLWQAQSTDPAPIRPWTRMTEAQDYKAALKSFHEACDTAGLPYEQCVIVMEALLIQQRGTAVTREKSKGKKTTNRTLFVPWLDVLKSGVSPTRVALLIYAGARKPSDALAWADRSDRTLLSFAQLGNHVPRKVARGVDNDGFVSALAESEE